MNELMNDKGDCRTALATLCLLKTYVDSCKRFTFFNDNTTECM